MAELGRQLAGHRLVGLDTSIFIYHLENHARYQPLTAVIFDGIQQGRWPAVASTVALMELTVHPWRISEPMIAHQYEALLIHFPNLQLVDVTREVARRAAQLRAQYDVRPADALHVATALVHQATAYITNDKALGRLDSLLDILVLDDFA